MVIDKRARILCYDIETAMNLGGYFGPAYEVNVAKVVQRGFVLGFAYKWLHKPKIYKCYIWDFPRYKKEPRNDVEVIKKWAELMKDTDTVVGQNSDQFDNKVMYGRLIVHNLPPLPMPQSADTKKIAKRIARYDSNKLDDLAESFGYGKKIKTDIDLWWDCMSGVKKAQKQMETYNKRDVEITEKVYLRLLPHAAAYPNRASIEGRPDACPRCGGGPLHVKGMQISRVAKYNRWQCQECGGYCRSRVAEKTKDKVRFV